MFERSGSLLQSVPLKSSVAVAGEFVVFGQRRHLRRAHLQLGLHTPAVIPVLYLVADRLGKKVRPGTLGRLKVG